MQKKLILYGVVLAALAAALNLAEYRFIVVDHRIEIYMGIIAIVFIALGAFIGRRLTSPQQVVVEKLVAVPVSPATPFVLNDAVLDKLGISKREHEVLLLMAEGLSNQEIAERSYVSVNTIKTHVSNLLLKLDAKRRTQAVLKARELGIVP